MSYLNNAFMTIKNHYMMGFIKVKPTEFERFRVQITKYDDSNLLSIILHHPEKRYIYIFQKLLTVI